MPVFLAREAPSILAVGGELKNTICLLKEDRAFLSQHIGDLENMETMTFFEECVDHLGRIFEIEPVAIAYDLHPDYLSTRWALEQEVPQQVGIQHHHAHIAACLAENGREERVIGIALDGTGYGDDGQIWGGEILLADFNTYERMGHFDYRPMPGGAMAIKEPWRMGIAYLYEIYKGLEQNTENDDKFFRWIQKLPLSNNVDHEHIHTILQMIDQGIHVPLTSSLGRLFDGVAALIGLRTTVAFEGQAAMELEMSMGNTIWDGNMTQGYEFELIESGEQFVVSPDGVIHEIIDDLGRGLSMDRISLRFHSGLIELFLSICEKIRKKSGIDVVALSGGCFQNRFLQENLLMTLKHADFDVLTHSQVPSNDGGIALGQAVIASYQIG